MEGILWLIFTITRNFSNCKDILDLGWNESEMKCNCAIITYSFLPLNLEKMGFLLNTINCLYH